MTIDRETVAFYDKNAAVYIQKITENAPTASFLRFSERLKPKGAVLDFGCGGGSTARWFLARSFQVSAFDASKSMIAEVQKTPGITTICADFQMLDAISAFDAIWANFSLQHVPREALPEILDKIATALRPKGWLHIGIHEGNETLRDSLGRLYCHHSEAALKEALNERGISVQQLTRTPDIGYDGRAFNAMMIEAQKHA